MTAGKGLDERLCEVSRQYFAAGSSCALHIVPLVTSHFVAIKCVRPLVRACTGADPIQAEAAQQADRRDERETSSLERACHAHPAQRVTLHDHAVQGSPAWAHLNRWRGGTIAHSTNNLSANAWASKLTAGSALQVPGLDTMAEVPGLKWVPKPTVMDM
eukprot:3351416-Prymnesium_polylepis.1